MAKISALTSASTVSDSDDFVIVQGGTTKKLNMTGKPIYFTSTSFASVKGWTTGWEVAHRSVHNFYSDATATHSTTNDMTVTFANVDTGSGAQSIGSDAAGFFSSKRSHLTSIVQGDIDGIRIVTQQGALGDSAGILSYCSQRQSSTSSYGLLSYESVSRVVDGANADVTTIRTHIGWINGDATSRATGYDAEAEVGTCSDAFLCDSNGGTWVNAFKVRTGRSDANVTYTVGADGKVTIYKTDSNAVAIDARSANADANAGPVIWLARDSVSAADNDLIGAIHWYGTNDSVSPESVLSGAIGMQMLDVSSGIEGASMFFNTRASGSVATKMTLFNGLLIGNPTGGDQGAGTINAAGDIYKNSSAFTNPDYVFEKAYTGQVDKFQNNAGALEYINRSIDESEEICRNTFRLPGAADGAKGIFERSNWLLEKLEEAYLYIFDLNKRLKELEK